MGRITTSLLTASFALFFFGCEIEESDYPIGDPISYEIITTSSGLHVSQPHTRTFRNWNEWSVFWSQHPECSNGCVFEVPYVDFENDMIIAVFWGYESNIYPDLESRIEAVYRHDDRTTVKLGPDESDIVLPAFSYSYLFIKLDRADGPVEFTGLVPR